MGSLYTASRDTWDADMLARRSTGERGRGGRRRKKGRGRERREWGKGERGEWAKGNGVKGREGGRKEGEVNKKDGRSRLGDGDT